MDTLTPLQPSFAGDPPAQWIAAPSAVYLTGEEFLRLTVVDNFGAAAIVTVTGRALTPTNDVKPIQFSRAGGGSRTPVTATAALSEGWLLGLTVRVTGATPTFGSVWCMLELVRGSGATQVTQTLGYGFVTANTPFNWPGGVNYLSLDGPGMLRSINGTTPGAGAEISETVPTGARWELLAIEYLLTTSAAVANRDSQLTLDDGANVFCKITSPVVQAASGAFTYSFFPGGILTTAGASGVYTLPLPIGIRLGAGYRLRTATGSIQAADQYSAVQYVVREWMTGE